MGVAEAFGWEDERQALNEILKTSGLTFEEFKNIWKITTKKEFRQYESKGFNTPTGKVELYSERLKKWGYDPLPTYYEPPETPYSEPDAAGKFPLILTSFKPQAYRHSWGHQISMLRMSHPHPIVMMHPETAGKLNIKEGDWVWIETKRGRIRQKAVFNIDLDQRVVVAEFGWWSPEKQLSDPERWQASNINILTDDDTPYDRAMGSANEMGTPTLRGMFCRIQKMDIR